MSSEHASSYTEETLTMSGLSRRRFVAGATDRKEVTGLLEFPAPPFCNVSVG